MEFWGVEVKAGESLKAALGEVKDARGSKNLPLRLKIDNENFIIGALSEDERTQLMLDLVFEKDFELSHDWKKGSVYFIGYIGDNPVSDGDRDDFFGVDYESEDEPLDTRQNGVIVPKSGAVKATKSVAEAMAESRKEEAGSDEDEGETESDSDDEMDFGRQESSSDMSGQDSEDDDAHSSEEEQPKAKQSKKRPAASPLDVLVPAKKAKAKSATPDKTGFSIQGRALKSRIKGTRDESK